MAEVKSNRGESPVLSFLFFALLAFLITWASGMLIVISTHASMVNGARQIRHPVSLPAWAAILLVMISSFGPFLSATIVTAWGSGRPGVHQLMLQFRRWRVRPIWYATAFLGPALLGFVSVVLSGLFGGTTPARWFMVPRPSLWVGWSVGPWGEELGWRGYAQPTLQKRVGAFGASVVVGLVWSLWHYWPVATPAGGRLLELVQAPFAAWLTYEVANSVMMAWLYNSTGGSLPIAWAAHVGLSLGQNVVNAHPIPFGWFVATFMLAAATLVILNGPRRLSRHAVN
jgi:uncharacterized protein